MQILAAFKSWWRRTFGPAPAVPAGTGLPEPLERRALVIIYNPPVPCESNRPLIEALGWNDPARLIEGYISDLRQASYGYLNYRVTQVITAEHFPVKADGFCYDADAYVQAMQTNSGFHQPDTVDYARILEEFNLLSRIDADEFDEVWLFGGPYAGFYESIMVGPQAFFCNAPAYEHSGVGRRFIIMGFNYQRGVGEMLEAFGHRAESMMRRVFAGQSGDADLWERFNRIELRNPGQAEVGSVHFAPNSLRDYDWGNPAPVFSRSRAWLNFPDLSAPAVEMTCAEWGGGDIRRHHVWWLERFPHLLGQSNGIAWNWWWYAADPNTVR